MKDFFLYTTYMKIHPIITHNSLQNIFYVLEYWKKQALIIDPPDAKLAQDFLDAHELQLQKILITHEHYDHYEWVVWLRCKQVYAGKIAAENMPISVTHIFEDEEIVFEHENIRIRAIFTPGHASGHMMFELSENNIVRAIFSGDALFQWGVGNTRTGSSEVLYTSIQKFKKYDESVVIYSWHDYFENNYHFLEIYCPENIKELEKIQKKLWDSLYFTCLWEERRYNPFVTASKEEFIRLRELRNNF